jgi:hypothetical protein
MRELVVALITAVLLLCAAGFALLAAFNREAAVDFGWVAVGCVIAAIWLTPALLVVGRLHP